MNFDPHLQNNQRCDGDQGARSAVRLSIYILVCVAVLAIYFMISIDMATTGTERAAVDEFARLALERDNIHSKLDVANMELSRCDKGMSLRQQQIVDSASKLEAERNQSSNAEALVASLQVQMKDTNLRLGTERQQLLQAESSIASLQQQLNDISQKPGNPSKDSEISSFEHGVQDRESWESWFGGLSPGDYRSGAFYWSATRNNTPRGLCVDTRGYSYGEFTRGCIDAKQRLDPVDQARMSDQAYKQGWSSVTTPPLPPPSYCIVIGVKPDALERGLVIRESSYRGAAPVGVIPYDGQGIKNINCPCDGKERICQIIFNGVTGWVNGQNLFPN